jgi:signal transduction histidine kinase
MRTALLAAVSHDLRTPLASIKASVSSLRQTDVERSQADEADLLATIEQNADRLDALIGNLLDMSRLHTGSLQPFGMDELLARLRAAVRRASPAPDEPVVTTADFTVDLAAKQVLRGGGTDVRLTPAEWQLLEILVRNSGRLVTQRQLLREVWGPAYETESNYLRVYLAQLRRKLEPEPSRPRYLLTESGMGYRFKP